MDNDKIIYNGVDISDDVDVTAAVHDMYAGPGRADTIELTMNDESGLWSEWRPMTGDVIEYTNGSVKSGKMYVMHSDYYTNVCRLYASSMPPAAKAVNSKTWQQVYLQQVVSELSERMGLSCQIVGFDSIYYDRLQQEKETDISFLYKRAVLEGGGLVIYDGKIVLFKSSYLESMAPAIKIETAGAQWKADDMSGSLYGSCFVKAGSYAGRFRAGEGPEYNHIGPVQATSDAELSRYAAGLLRYANETMQRAKLDTSIQGDLTAGVTVYIEHDTEPSWSGRYYIYRLRNEYHNDRAVIYLRKPLEGY